MVHISISINSLPFNLSSVLLTKCGYILRRDLSKLLSLLYQQTRLHLKLRERRVEALDQLKNQSEDIKKIETAIFSSGQRLGAVLKENHRLEIKMYSTLLYFFPWRFPVEYLGHKWLESMVLPNYISLSHFVSFLFHVGSRFKQVRLLIMFLHCLSVMIIFIVRIGTLRL